MKILVFLLILSNICFSCGFNIDLIFSLQQHFHSDVILLDKQLENEKIIKDLLDYQRYQPKSFIGTFDFDSSFYKLSVNAPAFSHYENQLVLFDGKSNVIQKLTQVQNTGANTITSFIWIFFTKTGNETQELDLLNIPYDSKFFLVNQTNFSSYKITDVYQIGADTPKIFSNYAIWENKELKLLRKNIFSNRMNLQGRVMQIACRFEPNTQTYNNALIHWKLISQAMNFTSKVIKLEWGLLFKNGTKTGTFEAVYNNLLDAGSASFIVSSKRLNYFDFIFPTALLQEALYVEAKKGLNWKSFITPFENNIWISVIAWVISSYTLMRIINHLISPLINFQFDDIIFNFIRAFCSQARIITKTKFSFYICMLMPYVVGMLLLHHYSANLLAKITIENSAPPFTDLEGVINDGSYKLAVIKPSYLWGQLCESNSTNAQKIRDLMIPFAFEKLISAEIFNDICKNRWVLFTRFPVQKLKVNCNIVTISQKLSLTTEGIIVKKGFPYRKQMMKLLRRFYTVGLVSLYNKNSIINWETGNTAHPLEFKTVFPAFLLLISFKFLSVLILIFERIIWKKRSRNKITIKVTKQKDVKSEILNRAIEL